MLDRVHGVDGAQGFEEKAGVTRETGVEHGAIRDRRTWTDHRNEAGGARLYLPAIRADRRWGQGGIGLGARLKRLGVPALIVDAHPRPGDASAQALQVASPA